MNWPFFTHEDRENLRSFKFIMALFVVANVVAGSTSVGQAVGVARHWREGALQPLSESVNSAKNLTYG